MSTTINIAKDFMMASKNWVLELPQTIRQLEEPTREFLERAAQMFGPQPALVPVTADRPQTPHR